MIVDDEVAFGQMVKLNLEGTGEYEVMVENKGERAYDAIKEFAPDMIFLDVIMPDVDGAEIARQIRADKTLKQIPVIFLTAMVKESEENSRKSIIAGYPHPCLAKPVTVQKLIECIKKNVI
jgi:CheY-like chemotaxis protein